VKKGLVILFSIITFSGFSQRGQSDMVEEIDSIFTNEDFKEKYYFLNNPIFNRNVLSIEGYAGVFSNAISANFFKPFIRGGEVTQSLIDNQMSRLISTNNLIGFDADFRLRYTFGLDSLFKNKRNNLHFVVGLADRNHLDANFTDNLFDVAFNGNTKYKGDTVSLGPFNSYGLKYQQLSLGLVYTTQEFQYGLVMSYLNGQSLNNLFLTKGKLITEIDGKSLEFDTEMDIYISDTANTGFLANNGTGVSGDFYIQYLSNDFSFLVEVNDLGFINWNENSNRYTVDTTYNYVGFDLKNLFDLNGAEADAIVDSTINSYLPELNKTSYNIPLPTIVNISLAKAFNKNVYMVTGIRSRMNSNYIPYYYLRGGMKLKDINFFLQGAYGGYSRFQLGVGVNYISNKFNIGIHSLNLEGLISPNKVGNQSIFARFAYKI